MAIDPFLLQPQIPIYASLQWDCCKWDANLPLRTHDLVRHGFDFSKEGYEIELSEKAS